MIKINKKHPFGQGKNTLSGIFFGFIYFDFLFILIVIYFDFLFILILIYFDFL